MPLTCALSPATAAAIEVIGATVVATTSWPDGADAPESDGVPFEPQAASSAVNNGTATATDLFTHSFYWHSGATAKDVQ